MVGRPVHRALDLAVIVHGRRDGGAAGDRVDAGARLVMAAIAVLMGFVWWQTDFTEKVPRRSRTTADGAPGARQVAAARSVGWPDVPSATA